MADLADLEQVLEIPGAFLSPPVAVLDQKVAALAVLEYQPFSLAALPGHRILAPVWQNTPYLTRSNMTARLPRATSRHWSG